MNTLRTGRLPLAILLVAGWAISAGSTEAQFVRATGPGYPNVSQFGSYGLGGGLYGGLGTSSFYGSGYGIGNGQVGAGYRAANQLLRPASLNSAPLTTTNYGPLFNAITSLPSWNATSRGPRPRSHSKATEPRDQLLSDDGKILWPSAAPDTPARHAAEEAVRAVVREAKDVNHASIRQVIDARNKLTAYARESLSSVKARNAADAGGLETFIVELEKTLQTLALNY